MDDMNEAGVRFLFSASTNPVGFFRTDINSDDIPADAVEIPEDEYWELIAGQSLGKHIAAGANGRPILIDPIGLTHEEKMTILRAERDRRIFAADNRVARYDREVRMGLEPTDDVQALFDYIQQLADLPEFVETNGLDPLDPPWPVEPA